MEKMLLYATKGVKSPKLRRKIIWGAVGAVVVFSIWTSFPDARKVKILGGCSSVGLATEGDNAYILWLEIDGGGMITVDVGPTNWFHLSQSEENKKLNFLTKTWFRDHQIPSGRSYVVIKGEGTNPPGDLREFTVKYALKETERGGTNFILGALQYLKGTQKKPVEVRIPIRVTY